MVDNNKSTNQSHHEDEKQGEQKQSFKPKPSKYIFNSLYNERKWLKNHGKEDYIDFKDSEILELRNYFKSLDNDDSGSIGVQELEDPLIALGLAQNRSEVQDLIDAVDEDGSHQIEFTEFLSIMSSVGGKGKPTTQGAQAQSQTEKSAIFEFFKKMSTGQLGDEMDPNVPFRLNVSQYRRRRILEAIMSGDKPKKDRGQKILQAFKKQLIMMKQDEKKNAGEDPDDISIDHIPNSENGANTRNGFPKQPRRLKQNDRTLIKPKAVPIQNETNK